MWNKKIWIILNILKKKNDFFGIIELSSMQIENYLLSMISSNLQLRGNQVMKFVIFIVFRKIRVLLSRLQG